MSDIMWLPKGGFVFGTTKDELINLAASSSIEDFSEWEAVAIIGTGAYEKGTPHPLAVKLESGWRYYAEFNQGLSVRVRAKVKFVRITREAVYETYEQLEMEV